MPGASRGKSWESSPPMDTCISGKCLELHSSGEKEAPGCNPSSSKVDHAGCDNSSVDNWGGTWGGSRQLGLTVGVAAHDALSVASRPSHTPQPASLVAAMPFCCHRTHYKYHPQCSTSAHTGSDPQTQAQRQMQSHRPTQAQTYIDTDLHRHRQAKPCTAGLTSSGAPSSSEARACTKSLLPALRAACSCRRRSFLP